MKKFFTLEEANSLLPYLKQQLEDIQEIKAEMIHYIVALEEKGIAIEDFLQQEHFDEEQEQYRLMLEQLGDEVNSKITNIQSHGCVLKDIEKGLIDFYAKHQDRDIFLCWKMDETEISFWHETTEGFSGRQSIYSERVLASLVKLH